MDEGRVFRYTVDLDKDLNKTILRDLFVTENQNAHTFRLKIVRRGTPVDLSGASVIGYFNRYKTRETVPLADGRIEGSEAVLTLSPACYAERTMFAVMINISIGDLDLTVFTGEGQMLANRYDKIDNSDGTIPTLDDLLAQINVMKEATADSRVAAQEARAAGNQAVADAQAAGNQAVAIAQEAAKTANDAAAGVDEKVSAANAELTGKVSQLSEEIGYNPGAETVAAYSSVIGKYINPDGNESSSENWNHTNFIPLGDSVKVTVNYTKSNPYFGLIAFYNSNVAYTSHYAVSVMTEITANEDVIVPDGAKYLVVTYNVNENASPEVVLYSKPTSKIKKVINDLDNVEFVNETNPELTWIDGKFIAPNGGIGNSGTSSRTDCIDVHGYESITVNFDYQMTQYVAPIAFYKMAPELTYAKENFIGAASCAKDQPLMIPRGANVAVVCRATADKETVAVTLKKTKFGAIDTELHKLSGNGVGVFFGDSIVYGVGVLPTDHSAPTLDVAHVVERFTGSTIYNAGIGGTTITTGTDGNFCAVVDAITGKTDWSAIDERINASSEAVGLNQNYDKIKALDFATVDFVLIAYGTNDWTFERAIGDDDSTDTTTYIGALNYALDTLLSAYPHLRVYAVAPGYRWDRTTGVDSNSERHNDKNLMEYAAEIETAYNRMSIPCKNLYREGMVNKYNREKYLSDGVHRNIAGYELLGRQYARFIADN